MTEHQPATNGEHPWTSAEFGRFIDTVRDDEFLALWLLIATTSHRIDALAALERSDVDPAARRIYPKNRPTRVSADEHPPAPSTSGYALDPAAFDALREHVIAWDDVRATSHSGGRRLFTWSDGTVVHPNAISAMFHQHCANAGCALPR